MFVVGVIFEATERQSAPLRQALLSQAENSLREEQACLRFDVAEDPEFEGRFFLYEVYENEAAFETHRQTPHYASFSETTAPLVANKTVNRWNLISGAE